MILTNMLKEGEPYKNSPMVRMGGFEPPSFRRRILSPLCMPFHHIRIKNI